MGQKFSHIWNEILTYPLQHIPITYNPPCYFTCIGDRRVEDYSSDTTYFQKMQLGYWKDLLAERQKEHEAKMKFIEANPQVMQELLEKFPNFTQQKISDLKLQFTAFDLNHDGLIDYHEMMQVLDDLGNSSSDATREEYFAEIDEDGSGAIDFEEFLGLIYSLQHEKTRGQSDLLYQVGQDNISVLRELTLSEKLLNGLF
ncbi:uncharacterized protein [Clytia hemisphaerica]|uniref:EF-hand domain-containing protein n=1 Tax=Clytia hemisphaerica TaxID=252671 RepID=A0A7M5TRI1_9CNID|eukprot:TCONS_00032220-protein